MRYNAQDCGGYFDKEKLPKAENVDISDMKNRSIWLDAVITDGIHVSKTPVTKKKQYTMEAEKLAHWNNVHQHKIK